ncbi:helix-turn-helix transcriptional regulator [Nonomuraea roseoviolacea]|uniref:helix-turn-helix domain-containing protein n=1 Tax=Nonomuraea roseoviolacea TaxID=103837 RepID=UPI0031CEC00C
MVRVRGHWRRLGDGRLVWIRPHVRGAVAKGGGIGVAIILVVVAVAFLRGLGTPDDDPIASPSPHPPPAAAAGSAPPVNGPRAALAETLRQAREGKGFTVEEAGRRAGVAPPDLTGFERGLSLPTTQELDVLAHVYGLSRGDWDNLIILRSQLG